MKRLFLFLLLPLLLPAAVCGRHRVYSADVASLQVTVDHDWLAMPVMRLGSGETLHVGFDQLSHEYHRYVVRLEHCEPDWTPSDELFESDWLQGFNDFIIEDYDNSLNTTVDYTHYSFQVPNDRCRLTMSGNYRLHVLDEDEGMDEVLMAEFRVVEPLVNVGLAITTNTDLGANSRYQQVDMTLQYNQLRLVTNARDQLQTFVLQNQREDNMKCNVPPSYTTNDGLQWSHHRQMVFEAGNEYRKYEVLDVTHPTMGIDRIDWDGSHYHAYVFADEPRRHYVYDEDADGAFLLRNSDNDESEVTSDYVYTHFRVGPAHRYEGGHVVVDGQWATGHPSLYVLQYNDAEQCYEGMVMQKLGYYSYQYLLRDFDGTTHLLPEEGCFFETENRYQALVYFKGFADRTWRLVGFQEVVKRH